MTNDVKRKLIKHRSRVCSECIVQLRMINRCRGQERIDDRLTPPIYISTNIFDRAKFRPDVVTMPLDCVDRIHPPKK